MNYITQHFTLEEFEASSTAMEKGINNTMPARFYKNVERLCTFVLEPLREAIREPIRVTSGFRCEALNTAVNGAKNSSHMTGNAVDFTCNKKDILIEALKKKLIKYDQCIVYEAFIHVSFMNNAVNRMQFIDKR